MYLYNIIDQDVRIFNSTIITHANNPDKFMLCRLEDYEMRNNTLEDAYYHWYNVSMYLAKRFKYDININNTLNVLRLIRERSQTLFNYKVCVEGLKIITLNDIKYETLNKIKNIISGK